MKSDTKSRVGKRPHQVHLRLDLNLEKKGSLRIWVDEVRKTLPSEIRI